MKLGGRFGPGVTVNKLYCAPCGSQVRIFSVATGEQVRALNFAANVLAVCRHPLNPVQLLCCAGDVLHVVDIEEGVQLKELPFPGPVESMDSCKSSLYWVSMQPEDKERRADIYRYDLTPWQESLVPPLTAAVRLGQVTTFSKWSVNKELVCVLAGKYLHVLTDAAGGASTSSAKLGGDFITCLRAHPTQQVVATGHADGTINLWYLTATNEIAYKTRVHWHAHGVADLRFSSDGEYLLSGGEEAVLVVWQLATMDKRFLARLGAPVSHIGIDPSDRTYSVTINDNSVILVDATAFAITARIQGFKTGPIARSTKAPLLYDVQERLIVTSGSFGALQFYNPLQDRHVFDVQVLDRNFLSRIDDAALPELNIDHFALTSDSTWLITAESIPTLGNARTNILKFWSRTPGTSECTLTTMVDPPHQDPVTSLAAADNMAVTAAGSQFKVWVLAENSQWECFLVGTFQEQPCTLVAISPDSSIIAAVFGKVVTLWSLHHRQRIAALPHEESINALTFVGRRGRLATATPTSVFVWDLLSLQVLWMLQFKIQQLVADSYSETFACVTTLQVLLFDSSSSSPLERFSTAHGVASACFLPGSSRPTIAILDVKDQIQLLGGASELVESSAAAITTATADPDNPDQRAFSALFASAMQSTGNSSSAASSLVTPQLTNTALTTASAQLMQPSHVAPPVDRLVRSYLQQLLPNLTSALSQADEASVTPMHTDEAPSPAMDTAPAATSQDSTKQPTDFLSLLASGSSTLSVATTGWSTLFS